MKFDISLLTFFRNHGIVLELTEKQSVFCTSTNLQQESIEKEPVTAPLPGEASFYCRIQRIMRAQFIVVNTSVLPEIFEKVLEVKKTGRRPF